MAAAPAEPNGTSIDALFRPSTRFRDLDRDYYLPEGWTEVELLPHLTPLDILATGVTWDEFRLFLRNKMVWMTRNVYVCNFTAYRIGDPVVLTLGEDIGTNSLFLHVPSYTAAALATATCDFLVRLFATCEERDLYIEGRYNAVSSPLSGAGLSLFFQESRDSLRKVYLSKILLSEDQCLALATMSRLDVEVKIFECSLADDAAGAFAEFLQSDRGPVTLYRCRIDNQILANALAGDSRVTSFKPAKRWTDDADKAILLRALANNRGLVDWNFSGIPISDENWTIMCQSLQAHPTLTSLNLEDTRPMGPAGAAIIFSEEQKTHRTLVLAEIIQENAVLQTITLSEHERDEHIYMEEIRPNLETNLYRPRVLAVKKTKDRPFREKVLGRAVYSVRSHPNLVWMLLSENVDAFARSEEEEEESNSEVPEAVAAAVAVAVAVVAVAVAVAGSKRKR
jgi:hypothetical protein